MSEFFDNASSEYLEVDTAPSLSAVGFSVMARAYVDDITTGDCTLVYIGESGTTNNHFRLQFDTGSGGCEWTARDGSAGSSATVGTVSINTWHVFGGMEVGTTERYAFLDGTKSSANTGSELFSGISSDRTSIGRMGDSTPGKYMSGNIDEVCIWDTTLTDDEWKALNYKSAWHVRRGNIVHYWKLDDGSYEDWVNSLNLTASGTPTRGTHNPPILPPFARPSQVPWYVAAAGGATGKSNPLDGPFNGPFSGPIS